MEEGRGGKRKTDKENRKYREAQKEHRNVHREKRQIEPGIERQGERKEIKSR